MNEEARKIFTELGSKFARELAFRDSWVFVGAKGVQDKSPFEQVFGSGFWKVLRINWNNLWKRGQSPSRPYLCSFCSIWKTAEAPTSMRAGPKPLRWRAAFPSEPPRSCEGPFLRNIKWIFSWGWEKKSPVFHLLLSTLIVAAAFSPLLHSALFGSALIRPTSCPFQKSFLALDFGKKECVNNSLLPD